MRHKKIKILSVFGTRPEAIKMAPLVAELAKRKHVFASRVCVSAQHRRMLDEALKLFGIRADHDLDIMQERQTLTHITVAALERLDKVLAAERPDAVLVHGDTTTTLAAALAAYYKKIPVGHVEAGLRTGDKHQPFPEEINRRLADAVCDFHFAPTKIAAEALAAENIARKNIFITGNTVIDALKKAVAAGRARKTRLKLPETSGKIVLMTCHRRENFGGPLVEIFSAVRDVAATGEATIIYPVHPNPNVTATARKILGRAKNVILTQPLDYFDLTQIMARSYFIVTDSGGIQEEAPTLKKPVLVLRNISERPEAVRAGAAMVVGNSYAGVRNAMEKLLSDKKIYDGMSRGTNPYGDGKAAARTADALEYIFGARKKRPADFKPAG